jgi:hypothetical protein
MKLFISSLLLVSAHLPQHKATASLVSRNLGFMEMQMQSSQVSETNILLRTLLSETVNFLDAAFFTETDSTFQKVSCSIQAYKFGGLAGDEVGDIWNAIYTANVTITGQVFFLAETNVTESNVSEITSQAFEQDKDEVFVQVLQNSANPFLAHINYAVVRVDGATVASSNATTQAAAEQDDGPVMEVWMIALVGGAGAFLLVFCVVVTCICCMTVDDTNKNSKQPRPGTSSQVGGDPTLPSTTANNEETVDIESKSPSPAKSIGSQDSSTFTYNPKSARSMESRTFGSYFTSNTGIEMDVAAWQSGSVVNQHQIPFGQDISAIEHKKDLSLIQEDEEESSSAHPTSPTKSVKSRASGKYKNLLANTSGGSLGAKNGLTEAAVNDMKQEERAIQRPTSSRSGSSKQSSHRDALAIITASSSSSTNKHSNSSNNKDPLPILQSASNSSSVSDPIFPIKPAEDDDDSSFYGPSYDEDASAPRLNLNGPAAEVMNDLKDLSSEIDQFRGRL